MYKTSIPIAIQSISDSETEKDLEKYLTYFRNGNIGRVFIAVLPGEYSVNFDRDIHSEKFKKTLNFFKNAGLEVGIWINAFGHGVLLAHDGETDIRDSYTQITGVRGETYKYGYCPLDKKFTDDYMVRVKKIAELEPDLIMIDDDFRMNLRTHYYMGCFCKTHLAEFYRALGEEIPREQIEELVFTGGENKYRNAYMDMQRKALLNFAKKVRETIDSVNPDIRAGACMLPSTWDLEGSDGIEIARAFAGKTKPFGRTFGAPYHNKYELIHAIERTRLQLQWFKESDPEIEAFSEGDVYTRPRYNVPSKSMELFDLALQCDPNPDGILKYMFDYTYRVGYEEGYMERHIKNASISNRIRAAFADKIPTGISVFSHMHKIRNIVLPSKLETNILNKVIELCNSMATDIISKNSISTCFVSSEYPVAVFGEDARYIPTERLSNGAVIDAEAARILAERGIDTGLRGSESMEHCTGEFYIAENDTISRDISGLKAKRLILDSKAHVLSYLMPQKAPGSYRYENKDGVRFLVFAADFQFSTAGTEYYNNYYRQKQVTDSLEWCGRKKLPVVCLKNPNLYILTSKNDHAMTVMMMNIFMDDIENASVRLDQKYSHINFVYGNGTLEGDMVRIGSLRAYDYCVFEVQK